MLDVYSSQTWCTKDMKKADSYGLNDEDSMQGCSENDSISSSGDKGRPVVIVVAGGGWLFANMMWGGLLARTLSSVGVIVVAPQYGNYPKNNVPGMIGDVHDAIRWTIKNCGK